jgi:ketosteroid isomerase-like protein
MKRIDNQATTCLDQFFEKFGTGNVNDINSLLTDDVEFHVIGRPGVVPFAGMYKGKDEVLAYLNSFIGANDLVDLIIQFHLCDVNKSNRISSHVNITSEVRSTGKRYDLEFLYKWELDDSLDKIKSLTLYYSTWHMTEAFSVGGDGFVVDQRGSNDFGMISVDFDAAEAIKDIYDKFYVQHDVPATFEAMSDDIVVVEKGNPALPSNGSPKGKEAVQQLIDGVYSYQIYMAPPVFRNFITQDNRTDVTIDVHFGDAVTKKDFHITLNHSLIFDKDGKLLELKSYHDSQEIWMNHLS